MRGHSEYEIVIFNQRFENLLIKQIYINVSDILIIKKIFSNNRKYSTN